MSTEHTVITITKELPLKDFYERFVDIPRCAAACAACPDHGGTWACPPFEADPEAIWQSFDTIMLLAKKVVPSAEALERVYTGQELLRAFDSILTPVKRSLINELLALEKQIPGSLALSAGGCDICDTCTRPMGLPCRAPEKKRFSIEAIGGDAVGAIEKLLGESILWAEEGRLPAHFILIGALLKKSRP
jgi:predicted metal-binding protein